MEIFWEYHQHILRVMEQIQFYSVQSLIEFKSKIKDFLKN